MSTLQFGIIVYILMTIIVGIYQTEVKHKSIEYAIFYLTLSCLILIGLIGFNM